MNLLDVNLLIALCDADHEHHLPATQWFRANRAEGWATCPLTENGLLRVMGHTAYPGDPGSLEGVRPGVRWRYARALAHPQYRWSRSITWRKGWSFRNRCTLSTTRFRSRLKAEVACPDACGVMMTFG